MKITEAYEAAIAFRSTLTPESDRGCALIAAAYIDARLATLLRSHFVKDDKSSDELLESSKALGTFSARIDLAYALGLLPREVHRDLHLIRKIRNDFGHKPDPITFDEASIASRSSELTNTWYERSAEPRARFMNAAMGVLATIDARIHLAVAPTVPAREQPDGPKLMAEFEATWKSIQNQLNDPPPQSYEELVNRARLLLLQKYAERGPSSADSE